jgi:hypothetical protein
VDVVTLVASVILLIEIPWSMISAIRITRRYRVRLVESRIFRWLTGAVLWVAALIALPIALDHELSRIARSADPSVTEL